VLLDGERVVNQGFVYLAMNKPVGYVSSRRAQGAAPTLYELLPEKFRQLKTVGRLDKESSGLILLTNDGDFAFQMTHPRFVKMKLYKVTLDKALQPMHQQMIADFGVDLPDGRSRLSLTSEADRKHWMVEMSEGRNRQIRRTFGALGYTVVGLERTQFGPYRLDDLAAGGIVEVAKL
jgi:23S rRNA pseudouridine2605 synthase